MQKVTNLVTFHIGRVTLKHILVTRKSSLYIQIIVDQKYGQSVVVEVKDADIAGADDSLGM